MSTTRSAPAVLTVVVVLASVIACTGPRPSRDPPAIDRAGSDRTVARPAHRFARIAVVGASVSAGLGGVRLEDAIRAAVPAATVTGAANVFMYRDAVGDGAAQIDTVLAGHPDLIVGIDFLFWHAYNAFDQADRMVRLDRGLGDLDRARAAGASVIIGDVPRIVTASELFISADAIPPVADLAAFNARLRDWAATRADVLVVPFASWAEPLAAGADVELAPGERMPARELMSADGLHPDALGIWYVMTRIDHLVEATFAVPAADWTFARPAR